MTDMQVRRRRWSWSRPSAGRARWGLAAAAAALCLATAAACDGGGGGSNNGGGGGNPVGPSSVNVGGNWKGTWSYTVNGLRGSESVNGSFDQAGASATGKLTAESGVSLTFAIDVSSGTVKGNSTLYSYGYGQSCSATGAVTGEAAEGRLVLRMASASGTACTWQGTENELSLTR